MFSGARALHLYRHLRRLTVAIVLTAALIAPAGAAGTEAAIDIDAALKERTLGDPAAPVTVIEYASLTCPHCAAFHRDTYKAFKERYIDSGKVRFIYRDYPLDGVAARAAMLARCTIEQRYFGIIEVLFKSQKNWAHAKDPVAELSKIGRLAGIDQATFDACMASTELIDGILRVRQEANAAGVQSTPTFSIDGKLYAGEHSLDELADIIEPLLKDK